MASAGQAQAHSSQPMHFSSPSGQRLSWCRPWKRGAVGCFSKGYCSVTTFLNMVRKVTPKPATGSQNCSRSPIDEGVSAISDLLPGNAGGRGVLRRRRGDGRAGLEGERAGGAADRPTGRHRRHGDPAARGGGRVRGGLLVGLLTDEEQDQE